MPSICFYFQVHQPYRLKEYTFFDIGNLHHYFDDEKNKQVLNKVSEPIAGNTGVFVLSVNALGAKPAQQDPLLYENF